MSLEEMKCMTADAARGVAVTKVYSVTVTKRQWKSLDNREKTFDEWYDILSDITGVRPSWLHANGLALLPRRGPHKRGHEARLTDALLEGKQAQSDILLLLQVTEGKAGTDDGSGVLKEHYA